MMNRELERFDPAEQAGRISYEHLHRYALSREYVAGMRVLDLGCGTGYGSFILAATAAKVTGVDISATAVRTAKQRYSSAENLEYICADCYALPFGDGSFDIVVANEMIEHVDNHDALIAEARRVLTPAGLFIVSTPNKPVYNRYKQPNVYHVSEMDIPDFRSLLRQHFKQVYLTGTRMALVSVGFELDEADQRPNSDHVVVYRGSLPGTKNPGVQKSELRLADPEYVLAICSQRKIEKPADSSSLFYTRENDLWLEHEKIMAWASGLHDEDEALRTDLARVKFELEAGGKDAGRHLEMSSRLLTKMTGGTVSSDHIAVVEAMFDLHGKLVMQEARLVSLAEAEQRAVDLAVEVATLTQSLAMTKAELSRATAQISEMEATLKAEAETASEVIQSLRSAASDSEKKLTQAMAELGEVRAALENARNPQRIEDEQTRAKRERFVSTHRMVRAQLNDAPRKVQGRIPPPPATKKSWKQKLALGGAPLRTVIFDRSWIQRQRADLSKISLADIVRNPQLHDIDPHPLFAAKEYRERHFDVAAAGMSPLQHYVLHGWREGRNPHRYFSNDWYLQQNPDVLAAGWLNPLDHYLRFGWLEGRWPNPIFDPRAYLDRYPDVAQAGMEPLTHYVTHGQAEGREPQFRSLDSDWKRFIPAERREMSLMDYMLHEPVAETFGTTTDAHASNAVAATALDIAAREKVWPPAPLDSYWPEQRLRDFIVNGYGEEAVDLYWYLLSIMERFHDRPEEFAHSDACRQLVARALSLAGAKALVEAPDASIIIPVHNNILDTLLCIVTVLETGGRRSFEIIVADDCSTDATEQIIGSIAGIVRYLRQPNNLGFLSNCNAAAERARGRHIVLLNNDTLVMPCWLDNLLAPFDELENVGLAGSKLINWDGSLQEAGGILWKDGSAWNFGRGQDPRAPEFSYLRDVDYCSGASIAIPTMTWQKIGGFDPIFKPAYCEDSDLAFRVRAEGYRTVLAPESEVIHHEGRSHGRDLSSGLKAYQTANQQRLLDRWRDVLEREHYPNGENVLRARDRSGSKRHILIIDHYVPQWDRDAGSRTMRQFMDALLDDGWAVTLWPDNLFRDPNYTPALQTRGVEVIFGPRFSGGFAQFLRDRAGLYDAVLLSRPHVAEKYIDDVRKLSAARVVYYGHDVHFQRMIAQREKGDRTVDPASIEAMRKQELGVCNSSDAILYPSREEAELIGGLLSSKALSMPIPAYSFPQSGIDDARASLKNLAQRQSDMARLLFVGGFAHKPNGDGIVWFCQEIVPILRDRGLRFHLQIAGSNPGTDIWSLEADDIEVLGFVSDDRLTELYREAAVVIAPLRYGAGVKGKVVEAMANAVPVVTTSVGAQGLEDARTYLFVGDSPDEFARAVISALDPKQGLKHAETALNYVQDNYSAAAVKTALRVALGVPQ